ncbi:MAG: FAD:protein FMN transferase, partial [Verrucomicrobia bacterium]|nr:FAD:protein FMN transferase [Verrucomicrobiota bacterium]
MATRFEIALHGENPISLRAAAEEALDEIERLESKLSLFRRSSDISRVNALANVEPVRVEPQVFQLLLQARKFHEESEGAFDITIAPLMRCWGFTGGTGHLPDTEAIEEAREQVGMHHVILDEDDCTVRFLRPGMMLDLGGIGKGFGLECAAESLIEAGVTSALLHGGTSTICAIGKPPEEDSWKVAIEAPAAKGGSRELIESKSEVSASEANLLLAVVLLKDEAMSVSGAHGKFFAVGEETYGHVLDPRSGRPALGAALSAVILKSATETDALSTALLTLGFSGCDSLAQGRPGMRFLLAGYGAQGNEMRIEARGIPLIRP